MIRFLWNGLQKQSRFECPSCYLVSLDPLDRTQEVLIHPTILENERRYVCRLEESHKRMLLSREYSLQVRCFKLDSKSKYALKYPDK